MEEDPTNIRWQINQITMTRISYKTFSMQKRHTSRGEDAAASPFLSFNFFPVCWALADSIAGLVAGWAVDSTAEGAAEAIDLVLWE